MTELKIKKEYLPLLAKRFGIEMIILFGSSIDRRREPDDFDLALVIPEPQRKEYEKDIGAYTKVWVLLGEALGVSPDRLDLTFISPKTPPLLLYNIAMEGKLIFGDPHKFARLRLYAWKLHQDTEYFRNALDEKIKRRLKLYV